ncbi:prostacyclin receptor [Paramormyrops kingsleyae]|uniref:Prostaglandin I2 receptor n=1 Tax=Paramormyrops kingsleyae TaxID=1676925 RepID=A0A3B3SET7_9TELE|nr:prostacyclin receptor [Paramormyrops kingsleyae]
MLENKTCENTTAINPEGNPVMSTLMFVAGLVGNLLALGILCWHQHKHRAKTSVFCILVTGLAVTDLLGTCFLSPVVFACYKQRTSLLGLTGNPGLCRFFAFAMTFFILASMLILCAMAVERCLAISHPYFYSKRVHRSFAKVVLPLIYLFTFAFCSLPFLGYGQYKQFCPGTWCFIKMEAGANVEDEGYVLAFSLSYASLMALLIVVVFVCNGSVFMSLCHMHRSQMSRRGSVVSTGRKKKMTDWYREGEEEVDHLLLLASMTVIFVICSLPLTICGFISAVSPSGNDQQNLMAFRFSAFNPIVDPWVFIICRKAVFRQLRSLLRCRIPRGALKNTAHNTLNSPAQVRPLQPSGTVPLQTFPSMPM